MTDTPDDQVPTDPWGNPLPPEQWPKAPPPPPPMPPDAGPTGWAQPDPGSLPPDAWAPRSYEPGAQPPVGYQPPPGYPPGYGQPQWGAPPKNEGMAVGALVCGIIGTLCGVIGCFGVVIGPVAIVLGVVARRRIRDNGGFTRGDGLALAGIVLGIIGTVASIGWLIAFATIPELRDRLSELTSTTAG